jgi:CRP-like cAMP-binding protein
MDSPPRSPNGFLSSLSADDFELVRPYLRTVDLAAEMVLVEVGEPLKRAYLPHKGVISLIVKLSKGEHVQIAMIGRDSLFGSLSAMGDPVVLNSAVVLVPGTASALDLDRLRAAAEQRRSARRWPGMDWRSTRRSSRPPDATQLTRWNPDWRDVCCRPATCPAATGLF